jgi:hypothetical protein
MKLQWQFWRRAKAEVNGSQAQSQPQAISWQPLASSRELLGLQRMVGNQAVLQLLMARKLLPGFPEETTTEMPQSTIWRKVRKAKN